MKICVLNQEVDVIINRKNNKNTYIRVKEDLKIYVTTNYFTPTSAIKKLINQNLNKIEKMYLRSVKLNVKLNVKSEDFYYLGKKYDILLVPEMENVEINDNKIMIPNNEKLEAWCQNQINQIFNNRLKVCYHLFEEKIPYPKLKIKKMKSKWGVCNIKTSVVTLNSLLIMENIETIDYVIIHELSHFLQPNHSKNFWLIVNKYCPNYKIIRKKLKEQ